MRDPVEREMDGKLVRVYPCDAEGSPVVYASMFMEVGRELVEECERLGCRPFHLVSISHLRWDEELSPWPHGPVVSKDDHFTGEADEYARFLEEQVIPYVEGPEVGPGEGLGKGKGEASLRVIAGYSMGGLFALYAPYVSDRFGACVSASGSVWYPGFTDYVRTHRFLRKPEAIYLSLGDQESHTDDASLNTTERCMEELLASYQDQGIDSTFELNPGNHYRDATLRLAKGIAWALGR